MHVSPTPLCFTESVLEHIKHHALGNFGVYKHGVLFPSTTECKPLWKRHPIKTLYVNYWAQRERETVTNVFQTTRNTAFSKQHLWKRRSKRLYLITLPNNTCIYNECTWTHRHWFYDHCFAFCTDKLHFRLLLSRLIALLKDAEVLLAKWKETITFDLGRKWALPPGYTQMADPYCPGCCSSLTGQNFPGCMTAG